MNWPTTKVTPTHWEDKGLLDLRSEERARERGEVEDPIKRHEGLEAPSCEVVEELFFLHTPLTRWYAFGLGEIPGPSDGVLADNFVLGFPQAIQNVLRQGYLIFAV